MTRRWTRRQVLRIGGFTGLASVAGCLSSTTQKRTPQVLGKAAVSLLNGGTLVTSTSCPCCHQYFDVLAESGVDSLAIDEREDYTTPKTEADIPRDLWSCHTVVTDGYVFEGHLPLQAIEKVATERPDVVGIALPGMPAGSPGMGGSKDGEFVVYAIENDGTVREYLRR